MTAPARSGRGWCRNLAVVSVPDPVPKPQPDACSAAWLYSLGTVIGGTVIGGTVIGGTVIGGTVIGGTVMGGR